MNGACAYPGCMVCGVDPVDAVKLARVRQVLARDKAWAAVRAATQPKYSWQ